MRVAGEAEGGPPGSPGRWLPRPGGGPAYVKIGVRRDACCYIRLRQRPPSGTGVAAGGGGATPASPALARSPVTLITCGVTPATITCTGS